MRRSPSELCTARSPRSAGYGMDLILSRSEATPVLNLDLDRWEEEAQGENPAARQRQTLRCAFD
jgi:hypothetical protein